MEEGEELEIPNCKKCGSKQIRTTSKYKIWD
jgi:ribosomal protein L40E